MVSRVRGDTMDEPPWKEGRVLAAEMRGTGLRRRRGWGLPWGSIWLEEMGKDVGGQVGGSLWQPRQAPGRPLEGGGWGWPPQAPDGVPSLASLRERC